MYSKLHSIFTYNIISIKEEISMNKVLLVFFIIIIFGIILIIRSFSIMRKMILKDIDSTKAQKLLNYIKYYIDHREIFDRFIKEIQDKAKSNNSSHYTFEIKLNKYIWKVTYDGINEYKENDWEPAHTDYSIKILQKDSNSNYCFYYDDWHMKNIFTCLDENYRKALLACINYLNYDFSVENISLSQLALLKMELEHYYHL